MRELVCRRLPTDLNGFPISNLRSRIAKLSARAPQPLLALAFFFALISPKLIRFDKPKDQQIGNQDGQTRGKKGFSTDRR